MSAIKLEYSMKVLLFSFLLGPCSNVFSQRYLTEVYPLLDSTIAGVYGTALDYQAVNQDLLYDFYAPNGDTEQKRPLIIYIHGGGFTSGTRSYPSVKLLCRKMAMRGYAVATIDYRLDPNFNLYNSNSDRRAMTDAMHDAKQAIRYFKANYNTFNIDTNKIFIGGESAGAITSMMASFVDKQSEMTVYPMANPNNPIGSTANSTYSNNVSAAMCLCGMILDTTAMEHANNPPILWTHGSADAFIPLFLSFNVVLRAAHIGLPIQTKLYSGATHCPWYYGNPQWQTYLDSTITDITTFLYPKATLGYRDAALENALSIFPNPASNTVHIELDKYYSQVRVSVVSMLGKNCFQEKYDGAANLQLELGILDEGIYMIKVELDNNRMLTTKIIICNDE